MDNIFKNPLWSLRIRPAVKKGAARIKEDPTEIMKRMAFGLAESCVQVAFGEILWEDYHNGKLELTEEQKERIQELAERKLNDFRKPPI
jgi:hypothetical protein